jgi:tetratricopeptide (TPR) repeat protein
VKSALGKAQQSLTLGEFQKALDAYQLAYRKCPETLDRYIQAIGYIKTAGDEAFDREDFGRAQAIYELLLKNFSRFNDFANLLSFERNSLIKRLGMSRMQGVEKQVQYHLKRGDFQTAIDAYGELYLQYPSDPFVQDSYLRVLESIKFTADVAFINNKFALAGLIYKILLKNYPSPIHLRRLLTYNSELLDVKIENCRKILFENGLERYRSGNLPQAISIWRSILRFDPENPEVKKAVDTAILQSRNLERKRENNTK